PPPRVPDTLHLHDALPISRQKLEREGRKWSAKEEEEFKKPIRDKYEREGHPYYASARLWDDGVIDPVDTRRILGLAISASLNARSEEHTSDSSRVKISYAV